MIEELLCLDQFTGTKNHDDQYTVNVASAYADILKLFSTRAANIIIFKNYFASSCEKI